MAKPVAEGPATWGVPSGWVPVLVPSALAPGVLRDVAIWVSTNPETDIRDWTDANAADKRALFVNSTKTEWLVVTELADATSRLHRLTWPSTLHALPFSVVISCSSGSMDVRHVRSSRSTECASEVMRLMK